MNFMAKIISVRCLHENVYIEYSNLNIQSDSKLSKLQALIILCNENNVNTANLHFISILCNIMVISE